ncbi:MAG: LPP20 family lipoprotein [Pseudomonadota bacterium]
MLASKFHGKFVSIFVVLLLSLSPFLLFAGNGNDLIEELANGAINWSKRVITATGSGAPPPSVNNAAQARLMAKRAAILDARRNLLETVKGVRVDAKTTVQNFMTTSDVVVTRISGIVKLSRVIKTRYMSDGAVEVTVAMDLTGDLLKLMLQQVAQAKTGLPPAIIPGKEIPPAVTPPSTEIPQTKPSTVSPPPKPALEAKLEEPKKEEVKEELKEEVPEDIDLSKLDYSGLVVDARKLQLRPALIPQIMDQRGEVVYSAANLLQQDAVKMGVVGYAKDVDAAKKNQRVTENPFVIKGIQTAGEKRTDVVINDRDANVVRGSDRYTSYLKNGRVLIVYD